jgi:hypothetical protein
MRRLPVRCHDVDFFSVNNETSECKLEANWCVGQLNVGTFMHTLRLAQALHRIVWIFRTV